jgi:hypothetical protein
LGHWFGRLLQRDWATAPRIGFVMISIGSEGIPPDCYQAPLLDLRVKNPRSGEAPLLDPRVKNPRSGEAPLLDLRVKNPRSGEAPLLDLRVKNPRSGEASLLELEPRDHNLPIAPDASQSQKVTNAQRGGLRAGGLLQCNCSLGGQACCSVFIHTYRVETDARSRDGGSAPTSELVGVSLYAAVRFIERPSFEGDATIGSFGVRARMGWGPCLLGFN